MRIPLAWHTELDMLCVGTLLEIEACEGDSFQGDLIVR